MKFKFLILPLVAVVLSGCALLQGSAAGNDALKATQLALTTYVDVYQPAVIAYGTLPACPGAVLCKNPATLKKLQAVDAAAVATITAAKGVLEGTVTDGGQIAQAQQAISIAEQQIAASAGPLVKTP